MNAREITYIASTHLHTRPFFGGVYSSDTIPSFHKSFPIFYIVNTDVHTGPGKHWVMIFVQAINTNIEWFDPLGKFPSEYNDYLHKFVSKNNNAEFIMNSFAVQSELSDKCGQFCLTMSDLRVQGISYEHSLSLFHRINIVRNDDIVSLYVNEHMKKY